MKDFIVSGNANAAIKIKFVGTDPDGDNLSYYIAKLPSNGALYQSSGATFPSGTYMKVDTDEVRYNSPTNSYGSPLTTFEYVASDGKLFSEPKTVTISILAVVHPGSIIHTLFTWNDWLSSSPLRISLVPHWDGFLL